MRRRKRAMQHGRFDQHCGGVAVTKASQAGVVPAGPGSADTSAKWKSLIRAVGSSARGN